MNRILCFLALFIIAAAGYAQSDSATIPLWDQPVLISRISFAEVLDSCITALSTQKLKDISDYRHIQIMRCFNTIWMQRLCASSIQVNNKVAEKSCAFENIYQTVRYAQNITKVYPHWQPNRGMGYYFPDLHMELGGTPTFHSCYELTE